MLQISETPVTTFSEFQNYIYISKYSRFLHDVGRRETWPETVKRYFDFFTVHLHENNGYKLTNELRQELETAVLNLDVLPSMRAVMSAGPALQKDNIAGYNCLGGNTLVTTLEYGIIPIKDLKNKKVHIVDGNGEWSESVCKCYGEQDLYQIDLATSGLGQFSIHATANHGWILRDGSEKTTKDLNNGDLLANVYIPTRTTINTFSDDYKKGVIHGIVYGDGTATYKESRGRSHKEIYIDKVCKMFVIRLCGESKNLLPYFTKYTYSYPNSFNGDPVVYISDVAIDLKSPPDIEYGTFTDEYLTGFLRGWFAADGSVSIGGQTTLACIEEGKNWIYKNGPRLGFVVRGEYVFPNETNYGQRKSVLYRLELDRRYLTDDDIILSNKKNRYHQITKDFRIGKVNSIVFYGKERVFCFDVPTTHSFMLTKNILTKNCSYMPQESAKNLAEELYILMCGTGNGYSIERQYINKLPEVPSELYPTDTTIVVADSKLGWAKALNELLSLLYTGLIPKWDLSRLRPAGAILKTFGGRSSGPEPLNRLFNFIVQTFKDNRGQKLSSLNVHDIGCMVGDCVVVGGVRRSALISLSDLADEKMRSAKTGNWYNITPWRSLSNNSAVWTDKQPSMDVFINEWKALYESKSGERGIFSRYAAKNVIERSNAFRRLHFADTARLRDTNFEFGCNPSLRMGTRIWTGDGIIPIEQLENKQFEIRNLKGNLSKAKCWLSGHNKQLWKIKLVGGHEYYATAEHQWPVVRDKAIHKLKTEELNENDYLPVIQTSEKLTNGVIGDYSDGFVVGWNLGDGWITERPNGQQIGFIVSEHEKEIRHIIHDYLVEKCDWSGNFLDGKTELNVNNKRLRSIFQSFLVKHKSNGLPDIVWNIASEDFRKGMIDGLFSSDGSVDTYRGGCRLQYYTKHQKLAQDISDLLGFYGIKTNIHKTTRNSYFNENVDCILYRVDIKSYDSQKHFNSLFKLSNKNKQIKLNGISKKRVLMKNKIRISSIEKTDLYEDVWDISVQDETHCFQLAHCITGNCSEIILRPYEFCNLSTIIIRPWDTVDDLKRKARISSVLGTFQSTLTNFRFINKKWKENTEDERLLGVSMTGIMDNKLTSGKMGTEKLKDTLTELRKVVIGTNINIAGEIGIPSSVASTCNKPEGTTSCLVDSSSGMHFRHAPFYLRTARSSIQDPVSKLLIDQGFVYEADKMHPNDNYIFSFPQKSPKNSICRNDISAIEHLDLWLIYQKYWADHKPSITVSVKEHEWLDTAAWVYRHFEWVSGIAFLPYSEHTYEQAPFQELTEDQYKEWVTKTPKKVDWSKLSEYEKEDMTKGNQELACVGVSPEGERGCII